MIRACNWRRPDFVAGIPAPFSKFAFVLFCYITNHLMTGSLGNSEFCFPRNIEILGKQNSLFPSGPVVKCLVFSTSPIAVEWLLANLEILQNRPFSGIRHRSVYLLFAMGLERKRSSAKGFRVSLWIDFKGTNILFKPCLIYLGEQCFCLCNKVLLDGLASCHCTEKWHGTEYSGPAHANQSEDR